MIFAKQNSLLSHLVEQIYGVDIADSVESFASNNAAIRQVPSALVLDASKEGSASDFAQIMLNTK